jgi:hypothetical protein
MYAANPSDEIRNSLAISAASSRCALRIENGSAPFIGLSPASWTIGPDEDPAAQPLSADESDVAQQVIVELRKGEQRQAA